MTTSARSRRAPLPARRLLLIAPLLFACSSEAETPPPPVGTPSSAPAPTTSTPADLATPARAAETGATTSITDTLHVYRSPTCGCCGSWAEHMREAGFIVQIHDTPDLVTQKRALGVPDDLSSCHTGVIGDYVIEGHVPADAVRRFLAQAPAAAGGLAVPGMPIGSPGMEVEGEPADSYTIYSFAADGSRAVFERR